MTSTCTDLVHVPAQPVVYDTASRTFRLLHRAWTKLRAVLVQQGRPRLFPAAERFVARRTYKGRHHIKPGEPLNTRLRDAEGHDNGERIQWTPEPTIRQKIALARAQRARRRDLSKAWMHTGAFPVLEEPGWVMRTRKINQIKHLERVL